MSDTKLKNTAKETFTAYLKQRGMRKTPERYAILDKVFSMTDHFYIESLRAEMEENSYHVSRATLYNTIQLLVEAGLVRRHQFEGQPAQFERVPASPTGNHHHLICRHCGKVKEVKDGELGHLLDTMHYRTFQPEFFSLYVYGICSSCQRKRNNTKGKQSAN